MEFNMTCSMKEGRDYFSKKKYNILQNFLKSNCTYTNEGRCALIINLGFNKLTMNPQCDVAFRKLVRLQDTLIEVWYLEQGK